MFSIRNNDKAKITNIIKRSIEQGKDSAKIRNNIPQDMLETICDFLVSFDPDLFYLDRISYLYSDSIDLRFFYNRPYETIIDQRDRCQKVRNYLLSRAQGLTDYEKLICIHDLLARNVSYGNPSIEDAHSIIGPLLQKTGVCEGIAKSFKYLLDGQGIPCDLVYGDGINPLDGSREPHMWNLVQFNGEWRHVDVTFDITIRKNNVLRYDYFMLADSSIELDHTWNRNEHPKAQGDAIDYYGVNNLVMNKRSDLKKRVGYCLNNHINDCVVKIPAVGDSELLTNKVMKVIEESLIEQNYAGNYELFFNPSQHVYHISFSV